jgi:hypothetical protein
MVINLRDFLKGGEFLDHLNDCELHKEDCTPRSNLISYLSSGILSRDFNTYGRIVLPFCYVNVKPGVYPKGKA